ncbi:MAG: arginine--tRNA ligase [Clostridiales bacterium]|nr:arginine--tRNA ligase [Clostridiales bacterium]
MIQNIFAEALLAAIPDLPEDQIRAGIEIPKEKTMGDFAFPCFRLAKAFRKAPAMIAPEIAEKLKDNPLFEKVEAVGPYVNVFIDKEHWAQSVIRDFMEADQYGSGTEGIREDGTRKNIVLDYSSINVAKPFHIGHLRTTVIGNSIKKLHEFLGYNTISVNHLGDWGTQFGKMAVAYQKWGDPETVDARGVRGLMDLYVRFHEEAKKDPSLDDEARAAFTRMENNDEEILSLWQRFVDISLKEVSRVYDLLDVQFDSYNGESFYRDKMDAPIALLREKGLLKESEGAQVVDLSEFNMPPCLVLKSDGSSIYATRDIAAAIYRKNTYDFAKCLYVTATEQILHFSQVFKVIELMGYDWYADLVHIPYGYVSLEEGKLSTREGNVIFLEDLLNEAIAKTRDIMNEKNPDLENLEEVAQQVGVGAVVFHDLFNNRIKDVTFSWDNVLNFDGETGPYVQYTFARCSSVLRKAGKLEKKVPDASKLTDEYAQEIIKLIEDFPNRVREAAKKYEPYIITRYTVAVATAYNKFYHENSILNAEDAETRFARLYLTKMVAYILKTGLSLIGVKAPERM